MLGADGLHSVVRAMTLGDGPPRPRGLCTWRAVTTVPDSLAERLAGGEWWGRGSVFGAQHLPGNQVYWYAAKRVRPGDQTSGESDKPGLLDTFADWSDPVPQLIEGTPDGAVLRNELFDRPAPQTLAFGRVGLLGDAAHPMLPYLGQGACQAIEDGVAVADALAASSDDPERGLQAYSRKRLRPAAEAVVQSMRMSRVAHVRNPVAVALRSALLRRASVEATLTRLAPIVGGGSQDTDHGTSRARR